MTLEQLLFGLEGYANRNYAPGEIFIVHTNKRTGHQTPLFLWDVAEVAINWINESTGIIEAAKETDGGKLYMMLHSQILDLRRELETTKITARNLAAELAKQEKSL